MLVKTVVQRISKRGWARVSATYHPADMQGALGAAAKRALACDEPRYVFATTSGYKVQKTRPDLPKGGRYYEMIVEGTRIIGRLYEAE